MFDQHWRINVLKKGGVDSKNVESKKIKGGPKKRNFFQAQKFCDLKEKADKVLFFFKKIIELSYKKDETVVVIEERGGECFLQTSGLISNSPYPPSSK